MARFPILLLIAALGACAPGGQSEPEPEPDPKHEARPIILGRPGPNGMTQWRAVIEPGRLLLDSPTSAGWYSIPLPPPREETVPRRLTYVAERVTLIGEIGACDIDQYRDALPNRFILEWDGGRFEGCNGAGRLPTEMAGTVWELVRIGAEAAPQGRSPAAVLVWGANGGLGGTLACNDGGIRATWTPNGGFAAGSPGFEQTAMGCNDPAAESFGRRFWGGLETARSWRRDGDRLRIAFADGGEAELRFLLFDHTSSVSRP
jgi:hypothetical protein